MNPNFLKHAMTRKHYSKMLSLKGDAPFPEELLSAARQDVAGESRWDKLETGKRLLAVVRKLESANPTNSPRFKT
jgi:hypothetical protein